MHDSSLTSLLETFESRRANIVRAGDLEFDDRTVSTASNRKIILCGYDPVLSPIFVYHLVHDKYEVKAVADDERAGDKVFRHTALSSFELATTPLPGDALLLNCATHNRHAYRTFERIAQHIRRPIINFQQLGYLARHHEIPLRLTIDPDYYVKGIVENGDRFLSVLPLLDDQRSRETLLHVMLGRLTIDYGWFWRAYSPVEDMYFPQFFNYRDDEIFVDGGACDGSDTVRFLRKNRYRVNKAHLFEIVPSNLKKISQTIDGLEGTHIKERLHIVSAGLWHSKSHLTFTGEGLYAMLTDVQLSENQPQKAESCVVTDLDSAIEAATLVKLEIEGAEMAALKGARNILARCRPKLAISAYHLSDDIADIIEFLRNLDLGYRFRIRHHWGSDIRTIVYAATQFNENSKD
jgi:FkbM family methyltransferase